ncbi:acyltransferase family protein [Leptolyngbya cf. ectocarpi LEGE 11479]|uniref:Acyltransferase family protein n=1 Tax=Leptolyngbya cf. ectocarpi LEGE 11479 TaxID=1828722 RepID=A0A928ZQV6_LEPEC|nr:acyltransferase family protein [Leptolyngbya ectocarpi]MBE9065848.1 acyltransferase family protein [Leptolyngbya cf. ectocarpi LEGE 11479]
MQPLTDSGSDHPMGSERSPAPQRLAWLDRAKAYGMFLVYYGHFVETITYLQGFSVEIAAFSQYKFIYAFHMPLFFILSGFFDKAKEQKISSFLTRGFLTRILPAIFFNLIAILILLLQDLAFRDSSYYDHPSIEKLLLALLTGRPLANFITWFLFCLFTVECLNYIVRPLIKANLWKRGGLAMMTLIVGYFMGLNEDTLQGLSIRGQNFWYFTETLIGFSFYQFGFILKQSGFISLVQASFYKYIGLGLTFLLTVLLFDLNQGPFTDARELVLMASVSHGNLIFFGLTAITGSLWVIFLALCLPSSRVITFIGQNTLILLGLNFLFTDFTQPIVEAIGLSAFESWWSVLLLCTALTLSSFAVAIPAIKLLHRFIPQLVGKPKTAGPILPALLH